MATGDQLIPISLEDLPSLIDTYERLNRPRDTIDSVSTLKNYKRWLEDPSSPQYLTFNILTLNNEWATDGLFLLIIGNGVIPHTFVPENPRLATAVKLAHKYSIAMIPSAQEAVVESALQDMKVWEEYKFHRFHHFYCPMEKALLATYSVPDHIILRPLTGENAVEVSDSLPYKSANTEVLMRQMIEFLPSVGAFNRTTGELMAWCLSYMNDSISALSVKPQFRETGLAKLLCKKVMYDRALEGKASYCDIKDDNKASLGLFLSLGFEVNHALVFGGKNGKIV